MKDFIQLCKEQYCLYANAKFDKENKARICQDDVFVVWSCKTLQNKKALLSVGYKDAPYMEATYNGDKDEIYVDIYIKEKNYVVK